MVGKLLRDGGQIFGIHEGAEYGLEPLFRADQLGPQRVVAFVVVKPGSQVPALETIRAFGAEQLAAPKLPRELRVVSEIPRSTGGKALRRLLRDS